MKIILSLLAVSGVMVAQPMNGQQYEDMMKAAHKLKTFETVYYSEKKAEAPAPVVEEKQPEPQVEVATPVAVETPAPVTEEKKSEPKAEEKVEVPTPVTVEASAVEEKKAEPQAKTTIEVPAPVAVEVPVAAPVASIPEVVEGSGVADDECAADKKSEDNASK